VMLPPLMEDISEFAQLHARSARRPSSLLNAQAAGPAAHARSQLALSNFVRNQAQLSTVVEEHMGTFTVHQGKRYRATLSLGLLERFGSNDTIADRLEAAGFTEITITGSGRTRIVEALWPGPDSTAEMPKQIVELVEL
jgi:hypothetical protein